MGLLSRIFGRDQKAPEERSFAAAEWTEQGLRDWVFSSMNADSELSGSLATLRARSRQMERDCAYIEGYLADLETNVVGPNGFRLQMQVMDRRAGALEPDDVANAAIEHHWAEFCRCENFTVTGDMDAASAFRLAVRSIARDGGFLFRFVRGYDNAYNFAVQLFEVDHIDLGYSAALDNGNEVRQGVEVDGWGKTVAIYVLAQHPGDMVSRARSDTRRMRMPANEVYYARQVKRAGQTHGYPAMTPVLMQIRQLDAYVESEIMAARIGAASMLLFERTESTGISGQKLTAPALDADGQPKTSGGEKPRQVMKVSPGGGMMLPVGWKAQQFAPTHPTQQFGDFIKAALRRVAAGLGWSYERLNRDYAGVTYSSLRAATLADRDQWMVWQEWFISQVVERIFKEWLRWSLLNGSITSIEDGLALSALDFVRLNKPFFHGRRWPGVDPLKEVEAQKVAREMGWTSDGKVVGDRGDDLEDVYQAQAAEGKLARKIGIEPRIKKPAESPSKPDGKDDEDTGANGAG